MFDFHPDYKNIISAVNKLIDEKSYEDAYIKINEIDDKNNEDYLFYSAFIQTELNLPNEAIKNLYKLKDIVQEPDIKAWVAGFLADILKDKGMLFQSLNEVYEAYELNPNCESIKTLSKTIKKLFIKNFGELISKFDKKKYPNIFFNRLN